MTRDGGARGAEGRHRATIDLLARRLEPMRRLASPGRRIAAWGTVVAAMGLGLAAVSDLRDLGGRILAMPEIGVMLAGSAATAAGAAAAAVLTALPDRGRGWAALAVGPALLWLGTGLAAALSERPMDHATASLAATGAGLLFIVGMAVPVALLLGEVVRRGHTLRPRLTGGLIGLAAAAAAATLVALFHPYRPSPRDFAAQVAALAASIGAGAGLGRRLLVEPRAGEPMPPLPAADRRGLS
ncbi:NrsF family protein [Methylobacterium sp. JK268]